ncbi:hypothetical protein BCR33DRAFT_446696 [Rhizoclosmatium globosum]|uniref:Uncharacterized protein n=1 Tax=Rhizoclosmatium globosum TaxID=329046 RepID=A0A1Y2BS59_9FUNG|nr:hypothetical protein BCR33DRAFT_446696 [Rhizoclosmatium globosum]|eukprot:ORY37563.1 hypothetical protein BCR33DRAFT_446696 [Rhizoclosmatium globosum]
MSTRSDIPVSRVIVLEELAKSGAKLTSTQFEEVLASVNPDSPDDSIVALQSLGRAYNEVGDAAVFSREVLPAALTQSEAEVNAVDELSTVAPVGWWARFLDGVTSYSPSFDLYAFADALGSTLSSDVDTTTVATILEKSNCRLAKSELQHIEYQMAPGQPDLVLNAYRLLSDTIKNIGVISFVTTVSPILAKADKTMKKRNRVLKVVKRGSVVKVNPIVVKRDSTAGLGLVTKRGSFVGPEVVRVPSRGSFARSSTPLVNPITTKLSNSILSGARAPSPATQTDDEWYPVRHSTGDVPRRRRSTASDSARSMDSSLEKRKSYLEYLTDASSVSSRQTTVLRKRAENPADTILGTKLARQYGKIVSKGWWARFIAAAKAFYSSFDGYEFMSKLADNEEPLTDESLLLLLTQSGCPVSAIEFVELQSKVSPYPVTTQEFFTSLGSIVRSTGVRRFYYKVLPIWNNAIPVAELSFSEAISQMIAKYSGFKADTFTFITECQKLSPSFNVFKFFEAFSTVQVPMTEEKLAASFKYAGLDTTAWEYKRLSGYLLGFFNLDALRDYSSMVLAVGTKTFVSHLSELSQPTEEQGLRAGMAWVSDINDLGPKAKFDPSGFKNSMRVVDPVFNPENFVENVD